MNVTMKKMWGSLVFAMLAAGAVPVSGAEEVICDFRKGALELVSMSRPNTDRLFLVAPGEKNAPGVGWKAAPPSLEVVWNADPVRRIPAFQEAVFVFEIEIPAEIKLNVFNFRLLDATNEAFQYRMTFEKPLPPGIHKLAFPVKTTHDNAWGGNNDKKLDFPVMFYGVALDFPGNAPAGRILFRQLSLEMAAGKAAGGAGQ